MLTATPGHIQGRQTMLRGATRDLQAIFKVLGLTLYGDEEELEEGEKTAVLFLVRLGRMQCEMLDQVDKELGEIAEDWLRRERAQASKEVQS